MQVRENPVNFWGLKGGFLQGWVFFFFHKKKIRAAGGLVPMSTSKAWLVGAGKPSLCLKTLGKEWGVNRGSRTTGQCLVAFWAGVFHEVASSNSSLAGGVRGQCKGWQSLSLDR